MKNAIKLVIILSLSGVMSCATTGQFMPSSTADSIIGSVQTSFTAVDTWFTKDAINTQAYIQLLEKANKSYSGVVDIRDILWTTGMALDAQNKEIIATGHVIRNE